MIVNQEVFDFRKINKYNMLVSVTTHYDNKNLDSPYFTDNLNTPDNMSKNTHTKLFKLQFSGASGNK